MTVFTFYLEHKFFMIKLTYNFNLITIMLHLELVPLKLTHNLTSSMLHLEHEYLTLTRNLI